MLLTGLRWTADGAFCPVTPGGHPGRVGGAWGGGVRLCSTCCPPTHSLPFPSTQRPLPASTRPSAQGPGQMPVTLILKEAETKADEGNAVRRRRMGVGGSLGGRGGRGYSMCRQSANLISEICSMKINSGFLRDADRRKGFLLSSFERVHVISSTNINAARGYERVSRKSIMLPGHF